MLVVNDVRLATLLCILTMLGWGSWANTQKLAGKDKWAFPLYYWDYAIGVFVLGILLALTLGSFGSVGMPAIENLGQAAPGPLARAVLSGVLFNLSNILLVVAIDIAGMSGAFPIWDAGHREPGPGRTGAAGSRSAERRSVQFVEHSAGRGHRYCRDVGGFPDRRRTCPGDWNIGFLRASSKRQSGAVVFRCRTGRLRDDHVGDGLPQASASCGGALGAGDYFCCFGRLPDGLLLPTVVGRHFTGLQHSAAENRIPDTLHGPDVIR